VVFRVGGTIALESGLDLDDPYITIAGQSAPGGGIALRDYDLGISADHVVVRYLRVRPGDNQGAEVDSLSVTAGEHIILDHCSTSWSVDETLSTTGEALDKGCLITENLDCSVHSKGCHGYGSLVRGGWGHQYTFHHNLYAHHRARLPRPGNYNDYLTDPDGLVFDFRNNVVYNWAGGSAGYNADVDSITLMNFVGNYYLEGPDSENDLAFDESCTHSRAYFADNYMNGAMPSDPWSLVDLGGFSSGEIAAYKLASAVAVATVDTEDGAAAYARVLASAGASFPVRDAVDARIIDHVQNHTGSTIDDEDEVGGWPTLAAGTPPADGDHDGMPDDWESARGLDPGDPSDSAGDRDTDGYTNVEEYLNCLVLDCPDPGGDADAGVGSDAGPGPDAAAGTLDAGGLAGDPDGGAGADDVGGGCGCRSTGATSGIALACLVLLLAGARPRRRGERRRR